jgi:hypothetical protein
MTGASAVLGSCLRTARSAAQMGEDEILAKAGKSEYHNLKKRDAGVALKPGCEPYFETVPNVIRNHVTLIWRARIEPVEGYTEPE